MGRLHEYMSSSQEGIYCFEFEKPMPLSLPFEKQVEWCCKHGFLQECNDRYARSVGYGSAKEIIGKRYDQITPKNAIQIRTMLEHLLQESLGINNLQNSTVDEFGNVHYYLNNSSVVIEKGMLIRIWGNKLEITDWKKQEQNERLLATVVKQAKELILITDKDGIIEYVNDAFVETTGYKYNEVVGKTPGILRSDTHPSEFYDQLWNTIKAGRIWQGSFQNLTRSGDLFEADSTIIPIKNQNGQVIKFAAIERDVTQERKYERHLNQSQKMEAIGLLAGGIAHDFNNILNAIIGYTEITRESLPSTSEESENLQHVLQAGERARELVKQILSFSTNSEEELQNIKVLKVMKEVYKLTRASLPSTIEIRTDFNSNAECYGSTTKLHQVFMNLLTNAGHAMKDSGGLLCIGLDEVYLDDTFVMQYPGLKEGYHLKINISDTGCGMPAEVRKRIFEPFYSTKGKNDGTGLGLSVVHGIVESMGGVIKCYSEPGEGSVFTVFLPTVESSSLQEKVLEPEIPVGSETVLYVDDEPQLVRLGSRILENLGYNVIATEYPEEVQGILKDNTSIKILVTDVTMPGISGDELARILRKDGVSIPIILQTGMLTQELRDKISNLNIAAVLEKPTVRYQLAQAVRSSLDAL